MCVVVTVRPLANLLEGLFCKKKKKWYRFNYKAKPLCMEKKIVLERFNKERQSNV